MGDGKFVTTLHWMQQNRAGGFARFLFSDTPCQSIEGDIQQAGFGTSLKCTTFAYRQVGACWDFDLFDPTEAVADFEYQIGFVFGFGRAATPHQRALFAVD